MQRWCKQDLTIHQECGIIIFQRNQQYSTTVKMHCFEYFFNYWVQSLSILTLPCYLKMEKVRRMKIVTLILQSHMRLFKDWFRLSWYLYCGLFTNIHFIEIFIRARLNIIRKFLHVEGLCERNESLHHITIFFTRC